MQKIFPVLFILAIIGCGTPTEQNPDTEASSEQVKKEVDAVCIWDKVSVRETPQSNGTWLTSISVGETLTFMGEEAVDSTDKNRKYSRVKLADGTEGWSVSDFIIPDGRAGVFLVDNDMYSRPDLLTKTDKKFSQMDIVAIKSKQDDWLEITGKRSEGKWIENGWVKKDNISEESIDVAVAKFGKLAMTQESKENQIESLQELLNNSDYTSSAFILVLQTKLNEIMQPEGVMEADSVIQKVDTTAVSSMD